MKKILLFSFLLTMGIFSKAQSPMFQAEDKLINLGVGIQSYPLVSASLDYGIVEDLIDKGAIGVGPYVGFGFSSGSTIHLSVGARGTFHYPIIDDLDTYLGFGMGVSFGMNRFVSWTSFHPGFFLGANYPISNDIVAFGEIGSGASYLTVGITIRMD